MASSGRTRGVRLGAVGGVPITLTAGWALITIAMTVVFTPIVQNRLGAPMATSALVALAVPLLLALSVLIHEIAHGITAQRRGFRVREYVITLWGGHTTFMSEIDRPGAAAGVAFAGPAANLVLAGLGWVIAPQLGPIGGFLALTLSLTNAFVGVFNLLPASPLDGGKLLESLIWWVSGDRWLGMRVAGRLGQATAVAVIAGFVAWPYLTGTQGTLTLITGFIVALVIWQGAQQTVKIAKARAATEGFSLRPYLTPVSLIEASSPVSQIERLPALVLAPGPSGPDILGVIDPRTIAAVPQDQRETTPASAVQTTALVRIVTEETGPPSVSQIASGLSAGAKVFVFAPSGESAALPPGHVNLIDIESVLTELKRRGA